MPGIGSLLSGLTKRVGPELAQQAEGAAAQQIGAQAGSVVANAPHALRQRLGSIEHIAVDPAGIGSTKLDDWFPRFDHTVTVAIAGGPDAHIKDIWELAVATAFGRLRQKINTFAGVHVRCVWDITDKSVAIHIAYGSNGLIASLLGARVGRSAVDLIQRGPAAETVGGSWAGFLQTYPQLLNPRSTDVTNKGTTNARALGGRLTPTNVGTSPTETTYVSRAGRLEREDVSKPPLLPDDGRLITTAVRTNPQVQPPRVKDYTDYVAIVSNALTAPCYLPCKPTAGLQVDNPAGVQFHKPGTEKKVNEVTPLDTAEALAERLLARPTGSLDGVPQPNRQSEPEAPNECPRDAELRG